MELAQEGAAVQDGRERIAVGQLLSGGELGFELVPLGSESLKRSDSGWRKIARRQP
jgi:hypothetical protein